MHFTTFALTFRACGSERDKKQDEHFENYALNLERAISCFLPLAARSIFPPFAYGSFLRCRSGSKAHSGSCRFQKTA